MGTQRSVATSQPFRTLNGKLLHLSHLKVSNRRQTSAVLNGILQGATLNATALMVPIMDSPATANGKLSDTLYPKFCSCTLKTRQKSQSSHFSSATAFTAVAITAQHLTVLRSSFTAFMPGFINDYRLNTRNKYITFYCADLISLLHLQHNRML